MASFESDQRETQKKDGKIGFTWVCSVSRSQESVCGRAGDLEGDATGEAGGRGRFWIYGWLVGDR